MPATDATPGPAFLEAMGPLYLINLAHRHDRRREFAAELGRIGLSLADPRVRIFPAVRPDAAGSFPSIGARGCFLSHLGVLRAALAEDAAGVVVCEDDLDFSADFARRMPEILAALPAADWDMVYAGHYGLPADLSADLPGGLVRLDPAQRVRATHFLLFRRSVLPALIAYLEAMLARPRGHPDGGPMHVDGAFNWFRKTHPDRIALAVLPALGHQRSSRTDIATRRWFDRLPFLRQTAGALHRVAARLRRRGVRP